MKAQTVLIAAAVLVAVLSLPAALSAPGGGEAGAQTLRFADHVVINELDTNPAGDDSRTASEWIELYNPTAESVDIGGWGVASTAGAKKTMVIPAGTEIRPGQFLIYSYQPIWFADTSDSVELRDSGGATVDGTPVIADVEGDSRSWQRIYDALDSDSGPDWSFGAPSAGSSNGRPDIRHGEEYVLVTVGSDKASYLFGETAVISGSVSERVFTERPIFAPAQILVTVTGSGYRDTVTLYPDRSLGFSTSVNLRQVLGIGGGDYEITAEYAGSTAAAGFSVGYGAAEPDERTSGTLQIRTDSDSYIPGQTAVITASTTEEVHLEGLEFTVSDPGGAVVGRGTLFPGADVNARGASGDAGGARFATNLFIDTVSPVYGKYRISGQYADQVSEGFFTVRPDTRDASVVSLKADKEVYEPGDTVTISGRSNQYHVSSLALEVARSANLALGSSGGTGMKILDEVRLGGDGTFVYEMPVPAYFDSFGQYRATVSGKIGTFSTTFSIVKDADAFIIHDAPLSVSADRETYGIGETVRITGNVMDQTRRGGFETLPVTLTIAGDGVSGIKSRAGADVDLTFAAFPDTSGNFATEAVLTRTFIAEGTYVIRAQYGHIKASTPITVVDELDIGSTRIAASLDKEIYGLGDVLTLSGTYAAQNSPGVVITVHKPDGDTDKHGASINGGSFAWSWEVPRFETRSGTPGDRGAAVPSNLGTYRLSIEAGGNHAELSFKVSRDPENDSLNSEPITVSSDRRIYRSGDDLVVSGIVDAASRTGEGRTVPDPVNIRVLSVRAPSVPVLESNVYPEQGGMYSSTFKLPTTVFPEGAYKIKSAYGGRGAETSFSVAKEFVSWFDTSVDLSLALDADEYHPGQTVALTGRLSNLIYLEKFDISMTNKSGSGEGGECDPPACGMPAGPAVSVRPDMHAGFAHGYGIPEGTGPGPYEITVDAGFASRSVVFEVTERPVAKPGKIIDKVNRITAAEISITPQTKVVDGHELIPRVISGSLLASSRAEGPGVNLRITSPDGTCIIGQQEGCLVSGHTRNASSIYFPAEFGGASYKVRYNGPGAALEKFSILPAGDGGRLPDEPFGVSVVKGDGQASRFYYKITYVPVP